MVSQELLQAYHHSLTYSTALMKTWCQADVWVVARSMLIGGAIQHCCLSVLNALKTCCLLLAFVCTQPALAGYRDTTAKHKVA